MSTPPSPSPKTFAEPYKTAEPDANGWLPIASAPKDRRDILVFCPDTGEQFVAYFASAGWVYALGREGYKICCEPRAWRPLPAPPVALVEKAAELDGAAG